jgi:hypothetical protein
MDDSVLDSEIELRQLRLHQRRKSQLKRKYELQMTCKATNCRRAAHLSFIAERLGIARLALEAYHPESRDYSLAKLAALPPWSGTLRANPPRDLLM